MRTLSLLSLATMVAVMAAHGQIRVWHGLEQQVGHLGAVQDDFNLMGEAADPEGLAWLSYRLNGGTEVPLSLRAFRRLARDGDFNADIPIAALRVGKNEVKLEARWRDGRRAEQTVTIERAATGASRLPYEARFERPAQSVGQYVDGEWGRAGNGLRTLRPGYGRIFAIGEKAWQDYEVRTSVTIHAVNGDAPESHGGPGLGLILRFAGHVNGGHRLFPSAQPKFGYQPFGAMGWLRWKRGEVSAAPVRQFYPGDADKPSDYGAMAVELSTPYEIRMRAQTLPDPAGGVGLTEYSFKMWKRGAKEPTAWDWQVKHESRFSLRRGGVALVAHHVDATFGDVRVEPLRLYVRGRDETLRAMEEVMGPRGRVVMKPPEMEVLEEVAEASYTRRRIRYQAERGDWVPAYLFVPKREGRQPAVLCLHQTTRIGKGEPAGVGGLADLHYARELAEWGYVTLAPDYPNFGGYRVDAYALGYASATMKGIFNHQRAVDLLASLEAVDPRRIGAIGHSLGGHNALFLAAFDERVRAVVTSCGFTAAGRYYGGDLTGWSHAGYMPRVAERFEHDATRLPFDFVDILAAIAPRPLFINAPVGDANFDVTGVRDTVAAVEDLFRGRIEAWHPEAGHSFPVEIRRRAYLFLDIALGQFTAR